MEIKNKIIVSAIVILCCLIAGCKKNNEIVMEVRTGSPITTLILYNNVDVILTHRPQNDIQVSAPHRMIDKIETSINGSTLTIRNNNTMNWLHDLDPSLTVWVNVDSLSNIAFYGTAVLSTEIAINQPNFHLTIGKSSDVSNGIINIEIHVQQLEVEQPNGYSDINIRGTANDVLLKNNAFGPMNLSDLAAENVVVDCHGTNNTFVQTRKSLTGSISNVGDLYYSGNPETVKVNVTGDGQLIHIE